MLLSLNTKNFTLIKFSLIYLVVSLGKQSTVYCPNRQHRRNHCLTTLFSAKSFRTFLLKRKRKFINTALLAQSLHLIWQPDEPRLHSGMTSFHPVEETCISKLILTSSCKNITGRFHLNNTSH